MTISARIIKDSVSPCGIRLTTFVLKYPRFIHSEVMTHRMFSRNASSSRAIPFEKQMAAIREDMAKPIAFLENKKGMQGGKALSQWRQKACFGIWTTAGYVMLGFARLLAWFGAHKQYVNRLVEPFAHITVVLTGTDEAFANWYALRAHPDAQPEIQELAYRMLGVYLTKEPQHLPAGFMHLPFVDDAPTEGDPSKINWTPYIERSVACCARTSYNNHDNTAPSAEKDAGLHNDLVGSQPMHASPAEHQAVALAELKQSGNLIGWQQYRKTLGGEYIKYIPDLKVHYERRRQSYS